jgi:hypothetical protein
MKRWASAGGLLLTLASAMVAFGADASGTGERTSVHLHKAKVYLAAGDYRRALEACQREIDEAPSAQSYVFMTYVLHAIDGYLDHLAATDRWIGVDHLYTNLVFQGPQDLADPPDVLARIAKEIIQGGVRKQADVTAAMAARLDETVVAQLWKQQSVWRTEHPDRWWAGVPAQWGW